MIAKAESIHVAKKDFEQQMKEFFISKQWTILKGPEVYYNEEKWRVAVDVKDPNGKTYEFRNVIEFHIDGIDLPFRPAWKTFSLDF